MSTPLPGTVTAKLASNMYAFKMEMAEGKVWRFRKPRQNYGALPERPRPTQIEQVTVSEHLSNILANRGVKVNKDRSGRWWADVEDEAWGADDWLTECFGERYGQHPYTFDNALNLLRQADEARRCLKGR